MSSGYGSTDGTMMQVWKYEGSSGQPEKFDQTQK